MHHFQRNASRLVLASLLTSAAAAQGVQTVEPPLNKVDDGYPIPPPPGQTDAGGLNMPNLGMHHIKSVADSFDGIFPSAPIDLPPGTIPPQNPIPLGWIIDEVNLYLPDIPEQIGQTQILKEKVSIHHRGELPEPLYLGNTDPSGSLDDTALNPDGSRRHFNLHWGEPKKFWLDEQGLSPTAPTDDLERILKEIVATGSKSRIQEAIDILRGTNLSGALDDKVYNGISMLRTKKAKINESYDPETRNIVVTQLWYGTEIISDAPMMRVPDYGDYTITWKLRGLGDIGPNREFAFPIDEFTPMPMKEASNSDFWVENNWIWKWFDSVQYMDGRKYTLEDMYRLHTGTDAAPSYQDLNPADPRFWLHIDRKFHMGSYVGEGDLSNFSRMHSYDLDLNGQIGGYLVDGTNTGSPYDSVTNPEAQFNQFQNNEYAVPRINWASGPIHTPYFSYDSSFLTIRKGQGIDVTIRYSDGEMQAGLYNWGWRVHPPRINWIETYSEGQILPSGAPKKWRFGHKWDQIEVLGLGAVGAHAPEKIIFEALRAYGISPGQPADLATFTAAIAGQMMHVRDRRGLPATDDILDFPNPAADANFLYTNFDMYGDRETINPPGKKTWAEGDVITITIHNDDAIERYFRVVDFGTTNYQYNGTDMGLLDWKPVFGFPQIAALAWGPPTSAPTLGFGDQGQGVNFWHDTALEGTGNPFYIDPNFQDLANHWPAGERDLVHHFSDLAGFSGPGFTSEAMDPFGIWNSTKISGLPTGDPNIWNYSYGKPIPPHTTMTFQVEMPRAAALNNGAMYMFDPQFHFSSIFTMHPTSELEVEGLDD